jgi:Family of unknown function (DUF5908)
MPLEIREIGIRMRVGEPEPTPAHVAVDESGNERVRDTIVEDCVRRVMAILKSRRER